MLVSKNASVFPNAKHETARAVYGPMPGRVSSSRGDKISNDRTSKSLRDFGFCALGDLRFATVLNRLRELVRNFAACAFTKILAVSFKAKARLQYPSPAHVLRSFLSEVLERDSKVGNALRKSLYFGITLVTCVCWSITSETKILYGSFVFLHGKSRRLVLYQERIVR